MLFLNSPQNPIGKVYNRAELELSARLCIKHDLIAVTGGRVGWAAGPTVLIETLLRAKQFVSFCGVARRLRRGFNR